MAIQITQQDIDIIKQSQKNIYVKINLLNNNKKIVDSLEGVATSASLQIDAESSMRRTTNVSFFVKNKNYLTDADSRIWLDKLVALYVGYLHQRSKKIIWYKLGTFVFNTTNFIYSASDKSVSISCNDLMCNLTGDRKGKINASSVTIPVGSDIRDSIVSVITQNGGVVNYLIEDINKTVPYNLEFGSGVTVYSVIDKLINLYPAWEKFFDVDGVFITRPIPTCDNDTNIVDETFFDGIVVDEKCDINLNEVKNVVTVWGKDGLNSTWKDNNPDSPYYVGKIGEFEEILSGDEYDDIDTQDLCDQRAAYEGWKRTRLNDGYTIQMLTVPWFPVNRKFAYKSKMTGKIHDYIAKNISMDLISGLMTMQMSRFYPLYPSILNTDFIYHLY